MTTQVPPDLLQQPFRKNAIINGNFDIWQRGTSFPAIANGTYIADRFSFDFSGAMVHSVSNSVDVPTVSESGIRSSVSVLCNVTTADTSITGAEYTSLLYSIEGYDYAQLAGANATLSFWVKGTKTGIHCIGFRNTGADRSYVAEYTIDVTDTWEKKIITVPLTETGGTWDYTNGKGLTIFFTQAAGPTLQTTANTWQTGNFIATSNQVNATDSTANNFRIAQVQFERGSSATEFERRHYADELALCQRYFIRFLQSESAFVGTVTTVNNFDTFMTLPVEMRTAPSYSATSAIANYSIVANGVVLACNAATVTLGAGGRQMIGLRFKRLSSLTVGHSGYAIGVTADAHIDLDAEL